MPYELFENYMNIVRRDFAWMEKASEFLDSDTLFDSIRSPEGMLGVLAYIFNDEQSGWIDYYVFELEWGKNYEDGMVTDKDGSNIPLATLRDLYRLLTKDRENNNE